MTSEVDAIPRGDVERLFDSFEFTEVRLKCGEASARQTPSEFPFVNVVTRSGEETACMNPNYVTMIKT